MYVGFAVVSFVAPAITLAGSYFSVQGYEPTTLSLEDDPNVDMTFYTAVAGGVLESLVWSLSVKPIWDIYNLDQSIVEYEEAQEETQQVDETTEQSASQDENQQ